MARFEVHIPSATPTGFNVTFRLEAEHWMGALKLGMAKLGEQGAPGSNMLVDILPDESIDVTDSQTGRVFRIRELPDAAFESSPAAPSSSPPVARVDVADAPTIRQPAVSPVAAPEPIALTRESPPPVRERGGETPTERELPAVTPIPLTAVASAIPVGARATVEAPPVPEVPPAEATPSPGKAEVPRRPTPPEEPAVEPSTPPVEKMEAEAPTPRRVPVSPGPVVPDPVHEQAAQEEASPRRRAIRMPAIKDEGLANARTMPDRPVRAIEAIRPIEAARVEPLEKPSRPITGTIGRAGPATRQVELLSELFERTQEIFGMDDATTALAFLLDLALEKIPCDAGSVFRADLGSPELELAAARGPKGPELERMKLRVPVGLGIVGFCAQEAVSLAISETEKDGRFYREVSDKLGYPVRSILCAPMVSGGRTFGCIEIINKKESSVFTDTELGLLGYIAHQGARFLEGR